MARGKESPRNDGMSLVRGRLRIVLASGVDTRPLADKLRLIDWEDEPWEF